MQKISRRTFLSSSTAAGLLAGGLNHPVSAEHNIGPLRLGLIGCGARGHALLAKLLRLRQYQGQVEVPAVADVNQAHAALAASEAHAENCADWKTLITREDLDGVVIATPDHWHAEMAALAMAAGKEVYCEQPMALHHTEAEQLVRIAHDKGRILQIGAQCASEGQWTLAQALVAENALGPLRWAQVSAGRNRRGLSHGYSPPRPDPASIAWSAFLGAAPNRPFDPDRYANWRQYWDYSCGVINEVHYPQLIGLLKAIGPRCPARVSVAGGVLAGDQREAPDSMMANLEYPEGLTIALVASMANADPLYPILRGEYAAIELRGGYVHLTPDPKHRKRFEQRFGKPEAVRLKVTPGASHLENWLACMRDRSPCACPPELGHAAQVATSMMARAYRLGKAVCYDPDRKQITPAPARA